MLKPFYKDWVVIAIIIASFTAFVAASEVNLFERVYYFTRDHEDLDLDELFSLTLILPVVIPILMIRSNRQLHAILRAKEAAEAHATHIALHDPLTGLRNRRHFHAFVQELIEAARMDGRPPIVTVIMIDLDRFKPINDLRGHEVGDRLLVEVGRRLSNLVGSQGDVIRLGGDEFVVVLQGLQDTNRQTAMARAILERICTPFDVLSWRFSISCSIGIAQWHPGLSSTDLLRYADQAMYLAKSNGRAGYAYYNERLGVRLRDEALFQDDLRQALDERQIKPYFQPIYDITTNKLNGFEVLSRWEHPDYGFVPPDRFINVQKNWGKLIACRIWSLTRLAETLRPGRPMSVCRSTFRPASLATKIW